MARIVFHALGSLGDLHPQLALALEMKRRGHACTLATHWLYIFPQQLDWPRNVVVTGPVPFDAANGLEGLPERVEAFLAEGPSPVVFTLGFTAAHAPGHFFEESVRAARALGVRSLCIGAPADEQSKDGAHLSHPGYVPYSQLLPRARLVAHQCGAGTSHMATLGGRPMLMVPYGQDQLDNALHLERWGVGLVLPIARYRGERVVLALDAILSSASMRERARERASLVASERGLKTACAALERARTARGP